MITKTGNALLASTLFSSTLGGLRAGALTDEQLASLDSKYSSKDKDDDNRPLTRDEAIVNNVINSAKGSLCGYLPGKLVSAIARKHSAPGYAILGNSLANIGAIAGGVYGSGKFSGARAAE